MTSPFESAVRRLVSGGDITQLSLEIYSLLSTTERLWLLDGDLDFTQGVKAVIRSGYNSVPYSSGAIKRIGLPGIQFSDGPRGCVMGNSTAFPVPMSRAATFDVELEERIGTAIGKEVRAQGGNLFGGVCVNLVRHPAWGRAQESYGEDPLILGELGAALARGAQQNVMACVKHFALNSMENSRFRVDVQVDEHDLHEVYLPHFKKIIQSGCFAVMSAYNSVQGEYCGDNRVLLTEILRDEWKFEGLVMSDFIWGLRKPVASTKNGLDVEMTFRQQRARALPAALESGELSENELRAPCLRLIATQLRHYAQLSQKKPSTDCLACTEHTELARKAAAQGMVLLKNTSSTGAPPLPLSPTTKRVALVGKLASQPNLGDKGSSNVHPPYVRTILQGFQANMDFDTDYTTGSDSAASIKSASEADVAVVVVGMDAHDEGEYIITDDFTTMTLFPAGGAVFQSSTFSSSSQS
ncbi:putative Thermostable beta-glucosidase B [Glarea lozoyensis 74030]|uniref:beta-glucosidase n=1 Tax=Glarea lozoyensis (strain ATCC 74030 / MF5533) TaxID=1104152 RepID=H0EDN8_GLAL7|nr:putative Thermostable beta-glucosidase B [Glarea lozoyensis 74030]